jgi:hypothetical protein
MQEGVAANSKNMFLVQLLQVVKQICGDKTEDHYQAP